MMALSKSHQMKLDYAKKKAETYRKVGNEAKAQAEEAKVEAIEAKLEEKDE
jgi:hypothetical protein